MSHVRVPSSLTLTLALLLTLALCDYYNHICDCDYGECHRDGKDEPEAHRHVFRVDHSSGLVITMSPSLNAESLFQYHTWSFLNTRYGAGKNSLSRAFVVTVR